MSALRPVDHVYTSGGVTLNNLQESDDATGTGDLGKVIDTLPGLHKTVLAANRGEIAIRIMRAAHELGMRTVGIFSYEDRLANHRNKATEAYQIAPSGKYSPVGAYLAIDDIISIAKKHNVSVIHPGYGFLSENAEFARKVEENGIAFAGPPAHVIENCGDKTKARELAQKAGVPVVPGSNGPVSTIEQAQEFVAKYGFPIIIKAAMGGGGRGMRVVRDEYSLPHMFERAQSEALAAFGDGTVFIERLLEKPRHIEVQLLADSFGNVIHLFERDCSVQRRHQKVVEMGPALNLPDEIRQNILNDAVKLAKVAGYRNAGTAEFLVDSENRYYFIEINPRIQVEHTVTEELTGVDLVGAQIQIALGSSLADLGLLQENIRTRGYAIQCRVTTEDPSRGFQPDVGKIEVYRSCGGPGVRLDGGTTSGALVTPHYDSLLVKITVTGANFDKARAKMLRALSEFRIRGVKTNIQFLIRLLQHETFAEGGKVWTTFIDDNPKLMQGKSVENGHNILRYLGELAINGSSIQGQVGLPKLQGIVPIPTLNGFSKDLNLAPSTTGWRNILLEKGPEAFCKAVRENKGVLIMDTTWRDAHQSLLATRVRTYDIARIATTTSHALQNAFALEMWGGATFDVSLRFLHECPWDRLAKLRKLCPNIPFQMLLRGANAVGYTSYPDNVIYEFCKKAVEYGIDVFRVFDSLNYVENLKLGIDAVKAAGGVAEGTISYTGDVSDPKREKYTLQYWLDLVDQLVAAGIHILGIKDMAGLLKPKAAKILIGSIRQRHPDLVIHLHTHDTAGTGVATYEAAAEAGVDVIDVAVDSMSGLTSQPSMGAITTILNSDEATNTNIDFGHVQSLNSYWEQVRLLYSCFDSGLKSGDSSVYLHEMPGGQYTNLLFQSQSLGLGEQWEEVKKAYATANRLAGDIVKVTPSSKVVGDLAQFIVSQKLTEQQVIDGAETLSFPQSFLEYLQGQLGIPPYGFPEPFRSRVLAAKRLKPIEGRPGASMEPFDFNVLRGDLEDELGEGHVRDVDLLSSALYPKVFSDYMKHIELYGNLQVLPTPYFLTPLKVGEEITFETTPGRTAIVQLVAIGPLHEESGKRDVYFLLNGEVRQLSITDENAFKQQQASGGAGSKSARPKANASVKGDVGAPMSGLVVEVRVSVGDEVKTGDPLVVMSAMKMETIVSAPVSGVVTEVHVKENENVNSSDLIVKIKSD
ncbi:pyruvate carboxylase [Nowakowskiella sp. JEL0407]|nr:pyruvate carboxylase [Nowakowskiella sp. JEL0407]